MACIAIRLTPVNACVIRIVSTDSYKRENHAQRLPAPQRAFVGMRLSGSKPPSLSGGAARREYASL
jgi:hypothetical protein